MSEDDSTGGTGSGVGFPPRKPIADQAINQESQVASDADAAFGKVAAFAAKLRRASYLALIKEGFTEQQALDLCWR